MSPIMMRQFWSLIETTQANIPLTLDDRSLAQWLLRRVHSEQQLDNQDADVLKDYIHARIPLIRDLAHEHRASC